MNVFETNKLLQGKVSKLLLFYLPTNKSIFEVEVGSCYETYKYVVK